MRKHYRDDPMQLVRLPNAATDANANSGADARADTRTDYFHTLELDAGVLLDGVHQVNVVLGDKRERAEASSSHWLCLGMKQILCLVTIVTIARKLQIFPLRLVVLRHFFGL